MRDDRILLQLYFVIVNDGVGRKVAKIAKANDITGTTVMLGRGTVFSTFLDFLGLNDVRKEIVIMAADSDTGSKAINEIRDKLSFHKPNHGIAFCLPISEIYGSNVYKEYNKKNEDIEMNQKLILTIVDRGSAEDVIDAATAAGSKGGTILNARGAGIHETQKVFNIEIVPEKEVVLIIANSTDIPKITTEIRKKLEIDEPGKGIIFVLDINNSYGLYDQMNK